MLVYTSANQMPISVNYTSNCDVKQLADRPSSMQPVVEKICASKPKGSPNNNGRSEFAEVDLLRLKLAAFMGNAGFHALVARALALAAIEVPTLRDVHVDKNGVLERDADSTNPSPVHSSGTCAAVLSQLLVLLVAFIGEDLTMQLVRETWPKLSLPYPDLDKR